MFLERWFFKVVVRQLMRYTIRWHANDQKDDGSDASCKRVLAISMMCLWCLFVRETC